MRVKIFIILFLIILVESEGKTFKRNNLRNYRRSFDNNKKNNYLNTFVDHDQIYERKKGFKSKDFLKDPAGILTHDGGGVKGGWGALEGLSGAFGAGAGAGILNNAGSSGILNNGFSDNGILNNVGGILSEVNPGEIVQFINDFLGVMGPFFFPLPYMLALLPFAIPAIPLSIYLQNREESEHHPPQSHPQPPDQTSSSSSMTFYPITDYNFTTYPTMLPTTPPTTTFPTTPPTTTFPTTAPTTSFPTTFPTTFSTTQPTTFPTTPPTTNFPITFPTTQPTTQTTTFPSTFPTSTLSLFSTGFPDYGNIENSSSGSENVEETFETFPPFPIGGNISRFVTLSPASFNAPVTLFPYVLYLNSSYLGEDYDDHYYSRRRKKRRRSHRRM